uniref:Glutathione S-transferase delta 1 n=2 Tax=Periplaneta americana TaxID=6978 RepID=A0A5Q0V371_PERAM|nr:glutathione S-transferase delta 1 [Periplaneta americana]
MPRDLYYLPTSAPCRSVLLTAKAVGVDLNLVHTDLVQGAHLKPDFLKMNPQHCIPVLNDNGFVLSESRAICSYLVDQYAKDDSLYPKDPKKRALVNQRLYFDIGTLYQRFVDYYLSIIYLGQAPDPARFSKLEEAFQLLDKFLEGQTWAAGDNLTIADFDLVTSVSSAETFDFDVSKYPNVVRWYSNAKKAIPGYEEINHKGCVQYRQRWEKFSSKNK